MHIRLSALVFVGLSNGMTAMAQIDIRAISPSYGIEGVESVSIEDTEIHYLARGSGEAVILLHGAMHDYRYWEPVIEALLPHFQVIAPSARHHFPNPSRGDLSDYTYENHVADLIVLIEALGIESAHLVGHSQGGNVAALTALRRPDLVRSLVLEEGAFVADPGEEALAAQAAASEGMLEVPVLFEQGDYASVAERFIDLVEGRPGSYARAPESTRQFWLDNVHTLNTPHGFSPTPLVCADLADISAPALMIRGDSTPEFVGLFLDATESCMGEIQAATIPAAAHIVSGANPEAFNTEVLRFLNAQ